MRPGVFALSVNDNILENWRNMKSLYMLFDSSFPCQVYHRGTIMVNNDCNVHHVYKIVLLELIVFIITAFFVLSVIMLWWVIAIDATMKSVEM